MMKKTTQNLLLAFSTLLLLVSVTGSAQGQIRANFSGTWNTVTDKGKKFQISLRHERSDPSVVKGGYGVDCLTSSNACLGSNKPLDGSINGFVNVSWRAEPVLQSPSSITGTVTDNMLRFTWSETSRHGAGRFTLSSDGESFEGTYSMTDNPDDTSGGTWSGTRQHSFAGAWQGKFGESFLMLILQQDGARVGGQLQVNSADFGIVSEGIVNGNTLRFNILRVNPRNVLGKPEYVGSGELVMNAGGKSFTGTILGAASSGTHVGR